VTLLRLGDGGLAGGPSFGATSPASTESWEKVLASAPLALPSQTPAWLRCVCTVDGYQDATRMYRTADGRNLVLPMVRRARLAGKVSMEASLPIGWGPAGLLGEGGVVRPEDVRTVFVDLARASALRISLRPDPSTARIWDEAAPSWVSRQPLMSQLVCLDGGFDEVWRTRFRADTRNRVRRAERAGVVVESDDTGRLVPLFQRLYANSVERWARRDGVPVAIARLRAARREPAGKLPAVAAELGTGMRVYAAFVDERPAAAIVVLFGTGVATYWRGAMDEDLAGRSYANYLLHRTAIEDASAAGCVAYQMGDSAPGSQLALFKSRFGAVEQPYNNYWLERLPIMPVSAQVRRRAGAVMRRWRGREQ
jgi:CelD/BcsL family acetyltransferase involved in cellulose biosynthesis